MESLGAGPDLSPVRVNFSARLTTAIALLAGRLTPAELEPAWLAGNEAEIRALAARVSVRHDPALTAKTLLGTLEAGASPDLGLGDLLRIRRRLADVNMDGANPGPALLGAVRADPALRRAVGGSLVDRLRRRPAGAIGDLDVARLRMTFPSRLRIRLRDGSERVVEGAEPGSCGRSPVEQRAVVEERLAVAGVGSAPAPASQPG
jgi:hypothetical protein